MELTYFYDKQRKLDEFITVNNEINVDYPLTDLKIIAFKVELSEFANEIQTFKFWKKQRQVDLDKAKEELMDCVHFLISIANDREYNFVEETKEDYSHMTDNQLLFDLYNNPIACSSHFLRAMEMLIALGSKLGMDEIHIKGEYKKKYLKNMKRQMNNY